MEPSAQDSAPCCNLAITKQNVVIVSPSSEAHEALMRQVYQQSGLDPRATAFVECHGTGTATGDPIETRAVGNIFGKRGVYIGSVKPNVGHSEGCSGLTSLIKGVLALEHKMIPPNIKFDTPNPKIPFAEKKLVVPVQPTPIPTDRAERISINSFGIGGSNAHVIIESLQQYYGHRYTTTPRCNVLGETIDDDNPDSSATGSKPHLLLFSAQNQSSLKRQIEAYRVYLEDHPYTIPSAAYTMAAHREKLPHRAFATCKNGQMMEISAFCKAPASPPPITMVFSGQGAQWPEMGSRIILTNANFQNDLAMMDSILQNLKVPPSWSILEELQKPAESSQINRAELAQPLCTALQIALFHQLERLGIKPTATVGHSSGEIAAAYAAGHISLEYALAAAYYRGYITKNSVNSGGAMAAVSLSVAETSRFLRPGVHIACENSPKSTTISGDREALVQVVELIKSELPDVFVRLLKVEMAYHSHQMIPLGEEYLRLLQDENNMGGPTRRNSSLLLSTVTCKPMNDSSSFNPQYWVDNLTSPVRFNSAVSSLLGLKETCDSILLEIGPHSTLAGPLREICVAASRPCSYTACQHRGHDGAIDLLGAVGKMYQEAVPVDFRALYSKQHGAVAGLPVYPWDHSGSFWYESRLSSAWRRRKFPHHCLLGARLVESPDFAPSWRNMLNLEDVPWIADHKIRQDVVLPLAGYIAIAGEAIRQITGVETGYKLRRVEARKALVLSESRSVELVTVLHQHKINGSTESSSYDFSIASCSGETWLVHCVGEVLPLEPRDSGFNTNELDVTQMPRQLVPSRFYEAMSRIGVVFGPEFQHLTNIISSATHHLASARIRVESAVAGKSFVLHPTTIDACIQLLIVANARGLCRNLDQLQVPVMVENIEISYGSAMLTAIARDFENGVECATDDGRVAVRMHGLQLMPLESETPLVDVHAGARLHWLPDIDFMDTTQLFDKPIRSQEEIALEEHLTLLCLLESADELANITPCQPHFAKYRDWLSLQVKMAGSGEYALVEEDREYVSMSRPERQRLIKEVYTKICGLPGQHALATGIKRIYDNCLRIFNGESDTLDLLMQDDILTEIYNAVSFGYSDFVCLLAHSRPTLRILEVGAGTGGTTELTLRDIVNKKGFPTYSTYTFTDVSAGFFPQAQERFAYAPNMEFKTFDISRSGLEQGFDAASYDLILAPNVVHATASLKETLSNLEVLLKPDGVLLLTELCSLIKSPNYIFGNFVGWWLGENDGRKWEPYVQPDRWDADLKAAGFTGVEAAVPDQDVPYRLAATIISRPQRGITAESREVTVGLLCQNPETGVAGRLRSYFSGLGWDVETFGLGDERPRKAQSIISCFGLESHFLDEDMTEAGFTAFQDFLRHLDDQHVLMLTHPFQVNCKDPRSAQTIGVARAARTELSVALYTLEIDPTESRFEALVCDVFKKIKTAKDEPNLHADREFVVQDGTICTGRYHPFDLKKELSDYVGGATTNDNSNTVTPANASALSLNPIGTYLLVGGTGGLGRSIATWLVEHGAKDLTFLSRRAGTDEVSRTLFRELHDMGCTVHVVTGKVEVLQDVEKAVAVSKKPVKGVFQLAMVLKDAPLLDMKYNDWVHVVEPKIRGTWNLHRALDGQELDFFWLPSSILSAVDQLGQANYLATGTFLEAFCQYRHSMGLPASVLNICPVEGVGFVAENPQAKKNMKSQGIASLGEREFLDFLELGLLDCMPDTISDGLLAATPPAPWINRQQVIMGLTSELDLADPNNRASWRHNRRMGVYHNLRHGEVADTNSRSGQSDSLKAFLAHVTEDAEQGAETLASNESIGFLAFEIGKKIHDLMLKPEEEEVDIDLTLAQIGLDSLMAIELRRWTKQVFGVSVSVLEIMGTGSLGALGGMVAGKLTERLVGNSEGPHV